MLTVRVYKLQVLAQAKASGITDDKCNQIRAMQLHTVLVTVISYETIFKYDHDRNNKYSAKNVIHMQYLQ